MAFGDAIQQERERRAGILKAASTHSGVVPYQNGVAHISNKEWDWNRTGLYVGLIFILQLLMLYFNCIVYPHLSTSLKGLGCTS